MDTQNQNTQPNFDFILEQPSLNAPKKAKGGKGFLLVMLLSVLVVIILAGLVLAFRDKLSVSDSLISANSPAEFVNNMGKSDVVLETDVYPLLGGNIASNKQLAVYSLERLRTSVDFKTCKQSGQTDLAEGQETTYNCTAVNGTAVKVALVKQKSDNKITAFIIKTNE